MILINFLLLTRKNTLVYYDHVSSINSLYQYIVFKPLLTLFTKSTPYNVPAVPFIVYKFNRPDDVFLVVFHEHSLVDASTFSIDKVPLFNGGDCTLRR